MLDNPQDFLEKHCAFDTNQTLFYSFDEAVWTSYSVLFTSLVVPCIRDQQDLFIAPPSLNIFDNIGFPFNFVLKQIPLVTLSTQIISYILSLVAYFSRSIKTGFPCFGLHVLLLPFSFGLLLPLVSIFVKQKKDKVPHTSLLYSLVRSLFPFALASIGLPGLPSALSCISDLGSCRRGCVKHCSCSCSVCKDCFLSKEDIKMYSKKAVQLFHIALVALWGGIATLYILAPAILFLGNLIISLLNSITITLVISIVTYEISVLAKVWQYRSMCQALKTAVKNTFTLQPEFDLSQVLSIKMGMNESNVRLELTYNGPT